MNTLNKQLLTQISNRIIEINPYLDIIVVKQIIGYLINNGIAQYKEICYNQIIEESKTYLKSNYDKHREQYYNIKNVRIGYRQYGLSFVDIVFLLQSHNWIDKIIEQYSNNTKQASSYYRQLKKAKGAPLRR